MATTAETIDTMLESVQDRVDDPELIFKLRTARQLVVLLSEKQEAGKQALQEADLDRESLENLRRLGYLE